jgi:hypothetical protein
LPGPCPPLKKLYKGKGAGHGCRRTDGGAKTQNRLVPRWPPLPLKKHARACQGELCGEAAAARDNGELVARYPADKVTAGPGS